MSWSMDEADGKSTCKATIRKQYLLLFFTKKLKTIKKRRQLCLWCVCVLLAFHSWAISHIGYPMVLELLFIEMKIHPKIEPVIESLIQYYIHHFSSNLYVNTYVWLTIWFVRFFLSSFLLIRILFLNFKSICPTKEYVFRYIPMALSNAVTLLVLLLHHLAMAGNGLAIVRYA